MITISSLTTKECLSLSSCLSMVGGFLADGYSITHMSGSVDYSYYRLKNNRNQNVLHIYANPDKIMVLKNRVVMINKTIKIPSK